MRLCETCGHSEAWHRHNDDLLEEKCGYDFAGLIETCGHWRCIWPDTLTDYSPRPECDCKDFLAPSEGETK